MKTSKKGREFIQKHEGFRNTVYLDQAGLPTAGTGHLLTAEEKKIYKVGKVVPDAVLDQWWAEDVKKFEDAVNGLVKVSLNQNEFDALVSLSFNIGKSGFQNSSVLRHLNKGDRASAAKSFAAWNKVTVNGKKVASKGLTRRRKEESELFLTPVEERTIQTIAVDAPETVILNQIEDIGDVKPVEYISPVSKSSVSVAVGLAAVSAAAWFKAFVTENIVWIVAGVVVAAIAALYWTGAKKRSSDRSISLNNGVSSPTGNIDT